MKRFYVLFRPGADYPTNWCARVFYQDLGCYSRVVKLYGSREEANEAHKGQPWTDAGPNDGPDIAGYWEAPELA